MADPDPLFAQMVSAGHAAFTLAALDADLVPAEGRESDLVDAAIKAGVLGALQVDRETPSDAK